jgi:hypothetical protein
MSLEDLDLEFEDEDENKNKKKETVDYDDDLEFHSPVPPRPRVVQPLVTEVASKPLPQEPSVPSQSAQVRKIDEARRPETTHLSQNLEKPITEGSSALKKEVGKETSAETTLKDQMIKLQIESQVKVSVAEFKVDFLSDVLSDMKLLEHQVGQLLARIHAKNPDTKNEVLMIKKIMADFVAKKRK